ncbi:MAG: NAD(P)-binding protein [Negativicutes bacterium]|nr:NAD(P)-binding protein [Negativicutes bacterium]
MRDFKETLKNCLREEPPFCSCACPFGLDVRDLISRLQRGSFNSAYRLFQNTVGFPAIVAQVCHRPCAAACIRKEKDEAVLLGKLEQAAVAYAANRRPNQYQLPAKGKKIAIIGAGPGGLACALRLTARKYEVVLYEKTNRIGGCLWDLLLPEQFLAEFELQLMYERYELKLNCEINDLATLTADAIYIATGPEGNRFGFCGAAGASRQDGIFLGGGEQPADAIATGLRMAGVIEAYLKTGLMRQPETRKTTRLVMDAAAIPFAPPAVTDGPLTRDQAVQEAGRCLKCQCDACLKHCDLMRYYGKSPGRIEEEVEVTIHPGTLDGNGTVATRLIASCNHCDVCKNVCPQGIDTGAFLLQSQRSMQEKGAMPWPFHDFWLRDLEFSNGADCALVRPAAPGERSSYFFFPGCRLGGSDPRYVTESYRYLLSVEPETAIFTGCCGAPALWAGDQALLQSTIEQIRRQWLDLGRPIAVFACVSCRNIFRQFLPEIESRMLYQVMEQHGFQPPVTAAETARLAVFDPCQSEDDPELHRAVRVLTEKAGCRIADEAELPLCCGWGGQVSIANPPYFAQVVRDRAARSELPYLTYCANCRDVFAGAGKPAYHLLDLLFALNRHTGREAAYRRAPTASESRQNRRLLKKTLLHEFFKEEAPMSENRLPLRLSPQTAEKLQRDLILLEDVEAVIRHCEASGEKALDESGLCFGHLQIGQMTFWVAYRPTADGFCLENAYCHRMSLGGE